MHEGFAEKMEKSDRGSSDEEVLLGEKQSMELSIDGECGGWVGYREEDGTVENIVVEEAIIVEHDKGNSVHEMAKEEEKNTKQDWRDCSEMRKFGGSSINTLIELEKINGGVFVKPPAKAMEDGIAKW